jgi:hypothetical protein
MVAAEVTVHEGLLGCVIVADDLTTVLARIPPPVGKGEGRLEIVMETATPGARLVFRNYTRGGRACVFTIKSVAVQPALMDALSAKSRLSEVTSDGRLDIARLAAAVEQLRLRI